MKAILFGTILLGLASGAGQPVAAQQPSPAAKLGMFPYPTKNQTKEQQTTDEQQCYTWAQQQTGIDPVAAANPNTEAAAAAAKAKADSATTGAAVKGAAGGAVAGVAIGAIAGDAGTGAAIGAVAGGLKSRKAKKQAEQQAAQKGAEQAKAQGNAQLDTYKKAMAACLEGRGYSVK